MGTYYDWGNLREAVFVLLLFSVLSILWVGIWWVFARFGVIAMKPNLLWSDLWYAVVFVVFILLQGFVRGWNYGVYLSFPLFIAIGICYTYRVYHSDLSENMQVRQAFVFIILLLVLFFPFKGMRESEVLNDPAGFEDAPKP